METIIRRHKFLHFIFTTIQTFSHLKKFKFKKNIRFYAKKWIRDGIKDIFTIPFPLFTKESYLDQVYMVKLNDLWNIPELRMLKGVESVLYDDVIGMSHTFRVHFRKLQTGNFIYHQFENRFSMRISSKSVPKLWLLSPKME